MDLAVRCSRKAVKLNHSLTHLQVRSGSKNIKLTNTNTRGYPLCWLIIALHWRHNDHDGVSNHQPHGCLLNRLFTRGSKKTSKLRVTGLCVGEFTGTGEFPAQRASYAENVSIWWRHHGRRQLDWNRATYFSNNPNIKKKKGLGSKEEKW